MPAPTSKPNAHANDVVVAPTAASTNVRPQSYVFGSKRAVSANIVAWLDPGSHHWRSANPPDHACVMS
jgi:hypothetical protein